MCKECRNFAAPKQDCLWPPYWKTQGRSCLYLRDVSDMVPQPEECELDWAKYHAQSGPQVSQVKLDDYKSMTFSLYDITLLIGKWLS